jgi:hypothetical protein
MSETRRERPFAGPLSNHHSGQFLSRTFRTVSGRRRQANLKAADQSGIAGDCQHLDSRRRWRRCGPRGLSGSRTDDRVRIALHICAQR